MKIIRREGDRGEFVPWHGFMNRFFDEDWDPFVRLPNIWRPMQRLGFPKVDISETEDEVKVIANIPGIDPDKVEIEVSEDTLVLSGKMEKEEKEEDKKQKFYRYEREYGEFKRGFVLPARVKSGEVSARAKNGVLTITLPKAEVEKKKKVEIEKE